jgi:hypothetical protein
MNAFSAFVFTALALGTVWPLHASAQSAAPDERTCRSEVSKFEEAIGYIRRTQGNAAAAELKEKLLPAKVQDEILFKDGYCGLARYLREKKLNR